MKKVVALFLAVSMVVFAAVAFAADPPAAAPAAPEGPKYGPNVGDPLKPFKLATPIEKGTVALEDLVKTGKDTMLVFMQSACSLCVAEVRELVDAADELKGNVNVLLVSVDYDPGRLPTYKQAYNIPFPILHDKEAEVLESVKFSATPATVIVDGKGVIKAKFEGFDKAKVKGIIKEYSK